jgi:hypothetical protein
MFRRIALFAVSLAACFIVLACGGRTENLRAEVGSDEARVIGDRQSLMSCTNGAGESIADSVFEVTADGRVYRNGELKTDQSIYRRNDNQYSYEFSWVSLLDDDTRRYDYLHHENAWLYNPSIAGEEFLVTEQRGNDDQNDVITYYEEGVTGESVERCGISAMTDRNFLSCSESGTDSGPILQKRKMARYDPETNLLSIDDVVRNLRPINDPASEERLTDLGDGWRRFERQTTQLSFQGIEESITRQTMEFNSTTGIVRNFESRNSPTPYVISCR